MRRSGIAALLALGLIAHAQGADAPTAKPQNPGPLGFGAGSGPVTITSDESLELQQANKVYIARGNAIAKRAERTLYGDTLMAYYRELPNSSQTEIWRIVADGNVKITTPTQTVSGEHGVYDLDTQLVVLTGQNLKLTTARDTITARDSLEWYDEKQLAVARGDAVSIHGDRRLRGDVLVAQVATSPGQASRISRVDGTGHVMVSGPTQIGTGDKGVYNADTGIATLSGHVTLSRGENSMVGDYGVIDLENGVSRLLPRPPTDEDTSRGRVQGYLMPHPAPPGAGLTKPNANSDPSQTDSAQKAQTDASKPR